MGPEKTFENKIKKWLKANGIWYVKIWSNGIQRSGIPDLLCCAKGQFIAIEVKAQRGTPSDLQKEEIAAICDAGGNAYVLKPSDWDAFRKMMIDAKLASKM